MAFLKWLVDPVSFPLALPSLEEQLTQRAMGLPGLDLPGRADSPEPGVDVTAVASEEGCGGGCGRWKEGGELATHGVGNVGMQLETNRSGA